MTQSKIAHGTDSSSTIIPHEWKQQQPLIRTERMIERIHSKNGEKRKAKGKLRGSCVE